LARALQMPVSVVELIGLTDDMGAGVRARPRMTLPHWPGIKEFLYRQPEALREVG